MRQSATTLGDVDIPDTDDDGSSGDAKFPDTTTTGVVPIHPGEILRDEFLRRTNLSVSELAAALKVSQTRLRELASERRAVTTDMALRLGRYFGTTPEFWLNLQTRFDLQKAQATVQPVIDHEVQPHRSTMAARQQDRVDRENVHVVDLGSLAGESLRTLISEQLALPQGQRSLWPVAVPAGGALAGLSPLLTAGNVFLATANPSTLMAIGSGFGTAVVHGGRIVAHAPFVVASSALVPIVTPVVLLVTLSAMATSARFDRLQSTVDRLADVVGELLKRDVGADFGLLLSAQDRLRDLAAEFDGSHRFTDEMKLRLSLLEKDLGPLYRKYEVLLQPKPSTSTDVSMAVHNQRIFALATIATFAVDRLRLKLALQDSPADLKRRTKAAEERHHTYMRYFRALADHNPIVELEREVVEELEDMHWFTRHVFDGGKVDKLKETREATVQALDDLKPLLDELGSLTQELHEPSQLSESILYLQDQDSGELRAYYGDFALCEAHSDRAPQKQPPEPGRRGQHPH